VSPRTFGTRPIGPGQGDIVGLAADGELDDAEAPADKVDTPVLLEFADDRIERAADDEKVDLGRRAAADEIADEAADSGGLRAPAR
jgi:hypothetical protein